MESINSNTLATIHTKSKRIKKPKAKIYNTQPETQKIIIIDDLLKALALLHPKLQLSYKKLPELIEYTDSENYNRILKKILSRHIPSFEKPKENLKSWRRKIKRWILSLEKPDKKGWIVPHENLAEFKTKLIPVLLNLPNKCFKDLKLKILEILEDINLNKNLKNCSKIKKCSKHFWYSFLERNQEIKDIWDNIPSMRKNTSVLSLGNKTSNNSPTEEQNSLTRKDYRGFFNFYNEYAENSNMLSSPSQYLQTCFHNIENLSASLNNRIDFSASHIRMRRVTVSL